MAEQGQVYEAKLRRGDTGQAWGFRIKGGVDQGMPIFIEGIAKHGRAMQAGVRPGDGLLAICGVAVQGMSHDQCKGEMLRAGNELDMVLKRGMVQLKRPAQGPPGSAQAPMQQQQQPRAVVSEEPTMRIGGPTYKQVPQKTFAVLQSELPASEGGQGGPPSSIFNRNKDDRSGYLHAQGQTIQKAYGEGN